jgi:hypothetical protein
VPILSGLFLLKTPSIAISNKTFYDRNSIRTIIMFVTVSHIHPSLIFVGKDGS